MKIECNICKKYFRLTYTFQKNINYIPKVCSSLCFIDLLKNDYEKTKESINLLEVLNKMKSKYEKAIAIWLHDKGFTYEYEPFIYKGYTPDFLVGKKIILEVKGLWEQNYYSKFKLFYKECIQNFRIYVLDYEFLKRINCKPIK